MFLRYVGIYLRDHTVSQPRKATSTRRLLNEVGDWRQKFVTTVRIPFTFQPTEEDRCSINSHFSQLQDAGQPLTNPVKPKLP
jgi:hypothetical protein